MWFDRCDICGVAANGLCRSCRGRLAPPPWPSSELGLDYWCALCSYDGVGRELIQQMKFHHRRAALKPIAFALAVSIAPTLNGMPVVVPVPPDAQRRHRRGFDLAELLAQALAKQLSLAWSQPLRRVDMGSQRERARSDRDQVDYEPVSIPAPIVILVDDVVTTGATMRAASSALRSGGTHTIFGVSVAVTPDLGRSNLVSQARSY